MKHHLWHKKSKYKNKSSPQTDSSNKWDFNWKPATSSIVLKGQPLIERPKHRQNGRHAGVIKSSLRLDGVSKVAAKANVLVNSLTLNCVHGCFARSFYSVRNIKIIAKILQNVNFYLTGILLRLYIYDQVGKRGLDNRQEPQWASGLCPCPSRFGLEFDTYDASRFAVRN